MNKETIIKYLEEYVIHVWDTQEPYPLTKQDWQACFLKEYSEQEKNENEAVLNDFIKKIKHNRFDFVGFIEKENFFCIEQ